MRSTIHIAQAVIPAMVDRGHGRIVMIASRAVLGLPTRTVYSSTKAAIVALGRTWALEYARKGILVNTISPGPVETDMFRAIVPQGSPEERRAIEAVPLGRLAKPDDLAAAVNFLLSPDSSFITGQNLFVCGGTSIGLAV
jgi:NAD(P)-dependent dehydrogenase (short-subunit alcohol dehydrogenase family)